MRHAAHLLLAVVAAASCAADPPAVRFPAGPAVPQPMPAAASAGRLAGDQLYVIESDAPVILLASPPGLVAVAEEAGPVRVRGKFVDGAGKVESRVFQAKQVFVVEALGTGRVELLVVPAGAKSAADVARRTVEVDAGHGPTPPPNPTPAPPVPPEPKPEELKGVAWVILIEETTRRTPEVAAFNAHFTTGPGRSRLAAKGIQYRGYDKDSPDAKAKRYLDADDGVGDVGTLPALLFLDATGKKIKSDKLPATPADLEALLGVKP